MNAQEVKQKIDQLNADILRLARKRNQTEKDYAKLDRMHAEVYELYEKHDRLIEEEK